MYHLMSLSIDYMYSAIYSMVTCARSGCVLTNFSGVIIIGILIPMNCGCVTVAVTDFGNGSLLHVMWPRSNQ